MIDPRHSVASIVLEHSACAPVFQRLRIDFCCKGELSLEAACAERGHDTKAVVGDLERAISARSGEASADRRALPTPQLIAHITSTHHAYLREALPFVRTLAAKVGRVHGEHNPRLVDLDAAVGELYEELIPHLDAEERVLFPALSESAPDRASVARELSGMREEHLAVGKLLERIRDATENFALPDWACNSYRALFAELEHLEGDVLAHVHLENHVLAPRFAAS